jgi:hypothetical protein
MRCIYIILEIIYVVLSLLHGFLYVLPETRPYSVDDRMNDKLERIIEGSCNGLIWILSLSSLGGTEGNHERTQSG